ncbi:hypothetical protein NL108_012554 [Boleophthalmus pectinirostris]|uniref:uncharacterized protein LOC110156300 n=1 Tax=Boleophthalmus pectinirostris TaxID=150288 RepID=UPI00242C1D67|nr:uncharacterized protein LOC110156300 [Boleophthalmus pectinirostris]KAJ0063857.1 hypothetical protein NL108_012554 [Boleophthalmus pectinirostris]
MMVGFLVILYKKHKLKKHQIATTDWAGPTPFLETGSENNGHVTLRSANRISLTSFLPQRLSKRLSLLAESGEEMQEMTTSSTFAGKVEKKVEENGPKANKTEKAQMNKPEKLEVDKTEKSEISTKTDDVVVVNETDKNGEIKNNDGQTENAKTEKEEDKASENTPAEPATPENPPTDTNNENKEETGKDGM